MKINEIAINESLATRAAKLVGKALPRVERLPGETMKDAIKRTQAELSGVKSADNLVSPEEMAALRRDPVPSSGPVAGTNTGSGFQAPGRVIPTQANTSYNLNLPKTSAAADPVPPSSGPAVWRRPGETGGGSSVPPAGGGRIPPRPTGPGVTIDQLRTPTNGPAAMNIDSAKRAAQASAAKKAPAAKPAETPAPAADDLAQQIRPGVDTPTTSGGRQDPSMGSPSLPPLSGDDGMKFTKAEILDMMKRQAAETPSINIGTDAAKKSSFPWKTTAAAAIAGPKAYNLITPKDWPKLPDSVANWPLNAADTVWKNFKDNTGVPTVTSVTPADTTVSPDEVTPPPSPDTVNNAIKNDTENQAVTQEIEKWNREHPDNPIKEGYTNELNRIVFLSRP